MMDLGAKVCEMEHKTSSYVNNEEKIFKNSTLKCFSSLEKRKKQSTRNTHRDYSKHVEEKKELQEKAWAKVRTDVSLQVCVKTLS